MMIRLKLVNLMRNIPYRAVALFIPFFVLGLHLIFLYITLDPSQFLTMGGLMLAYILPPAGKETVIPVGIALGIPWWYMALSIAMIDVETGLFMALNFDLAYRLPVIGKILARLAEKTKEVIKNHRWLAGLWFFAIVIMVMVPFFGSGGIRGSIAGKILGLGMVLVFLAILAGSLIGCFGIALGSATIIRSLCANGMLPESIRAVVCI